MDLRTMDRQSLAWGAGALVLAVIFGAFGAHGLGPKLSAAELEQWRTAVQYHFYHGLGLVLLSCLPAHLSNTSRNLVRISFVAGIIAFSGSIYILSIKELLGVSSWIFFLGPLTPIGGILFIVGWGTLLITALRSRTLG